MSHPEHPKLIFANWRRWSLRSRPSQDLDVPPEFGILGLYLLAAFDSSDPHYPSGSTEIYLQPEVVYIGMSRHVEQRLERTHVGVARYCKHFDDPRCKNLWFSTWHSDVTNRDLSTPQGVVALATIALYERWLLLAYARAHGRFPLLNKQ